MKKNCSNIVRLLPFFLLFIFSFTGCEGNTSVTSRAVVQTIGIDYSEDQDEFIVSLQYFSTKGSGGQQAIDLSKVNAKVASGSGQTINEAIDNAIFPEGKTPFYAQSSYIILGKTLVEHGVEDIVNYINLDRDLRVNTVMLVAEGEASDIVNEDIDEGVLPSDKITRMCSIMIRNGEMREVPYFKFASKYYSGYESILVPVIKAEETETSQDSASGGEEGSSSQPSKQLALSGAAIIKDAKGMKLLTPEETRGCLWLSDEVKATTISTKTEDQGLLSVDVVQTKTTVNPVLEGDQVIFQISIENQLVIREYQTKEFENLSDSDYQMMRDAVEKEIREECESAIEVCIHSTGADVFYFGSRLCQKYPWIEEKLMDSWEKEQIQSVQIELSINSSFSRL